MIQNRSNIKSVKFLLVVNAFLILAKLVVAILTGSIGVIAVLVDSFFDIIGSAIAYFGVKKGEEPPDSDHLYGHKKYEAVSSTAQLALIAITALLIISESVRRLVFGVVIEVNNIDLGVMLLTVIVDLGIVYYLKKNADLASPVMQASLGNYTSDIAQNSLVLVGLFAASSGIFVADPLAALIVACLMLRVVYNVGKGAWSELTDASPSRQCLESYAKHILQVGGVKSFHKMRARIMGGKTHIDLHIQVSPKATLRKAHQISTNVKVALLKKFPEIHEVLVHTEPFIGPHKRGPKFGS